MLDAKGYRLNVGIVIADGKGNVLWAKRKRQGGWQFPQGGMHEGESPIDAMYRELYEEVGLLPEHVELWGQTRSWWRYRLPEKMVREVPGKQTCIGQKQRWFLLYLKSPESTVRLDAHNDPEFESWRWVSYWFPVLQIIEFKRWVYRNMLRELSRKHSEKVLSLSK